MELCFVRAMRRSRCSTIAELLHASGTQIPLDSRVNCRLWYCPLCGTRRARRACPALDKQICAICCGTKRLVQIQLPQRLHLAGQWRASIPPASHVRQQQRDVGAAGALHARPQPAPVTALLPDCRVPRALSGARSPAARSTTTSPRQSGRLRRHTKPPPAVVIYEHRPASVPAERLTTALKPVLVEAGQSGGSAFERDAAVVLQAHRRSGAGRPRLRSDQPAGVSRSPPTRHEPGSATTVRRQTARNVRA